MSFCINSNTMELNVMPSQFLDVAIGDNQTTTSHVNKINPDMVMKSVSKSMKRALESETTIIPIYSSSKQAKLVNANSVYVENDATNDFPIKLPATLLAECTVEISDIPNKNNRQLADQEFIATVRSPLIQRKNDELLKTPDKELPDADIHDMITRVEAVYSDDEDSTKFVDSRDETQQFDYTFPFSCEYCPNKFSNRGALWQHTVATHSIEKTCECNLCGRKFYRNCSLALHMKSHSDEYNCACTICGREFNRFTLLQRHAKLHSEVAHFKCTACNKSFEDLNTLQLHAMEHKDKLACDQCNAVFSTRESLDVHTEAMHVDHHDDVIQVRIQGGENTYSCRFCGKTYGAKAIVKKHELIHTGERLKCDECGIEFTQKSSLMRHTKRIHPSVNC